MQLSMLFALLPLASAIPLAQSITGGCAPSTVTVTVTASSTASTSTSEPEYHCRWPYEYCPDYEPLPSPTTSAGTSISTSEPELDCAWPMDCVPSERTQPSPTTSVETSTSTSVAIAPTRTIDPNCPYGLPFCWPTV